MECRKNTFQYPVSSVTKANLTILIESAKAIAWKRQREQKWDVKDVRFSTSIVPASIVRRFLYRSLVKWNRLTCISMFPLKFLPRWKIVHSANEEWLWKGRGSLCLGSTYHWPIDATHVAFFSLSIILIHDF